MEDLDAIVARIGDTNVALIINGDASAKKKLGEKIKKLLMV
jgi:hypothetical protein